MTSFNSNIQFLLAIIMRKYMCSILTSRWSSKSEGEEWKKQHTTLSNVRKHIEHSQNPMSEWWGSPDADVDVRCPLFSFLLYPTNSSTPNSSRNDYNHIRRLCRRSFASKKWNYTIFFPFLLTAPLVKCQESMRPPFSCSSSTTFAFVHVEFFFLVALALSFRCCQSFSFCSRAALAWSIKIYVSTWMARDEKLDLYVYGWAARD